MRHIQKRSIAFGVAAFLAAPTGVMAGSLQVQPVLLDLPAGGAASSITLRNSGSAQVEAQLRVFRWSQANGEERLEPTQDVVASPPALSVGPNTSHVVRLVRLQKAAVSQEESYRILVDQLPESGRRNGAVNMVLRQSIPVFFRPAVGSGPKVSWSVQTVGDQLLVSARNDGDRRLRIAAIRLTNSQGTTVSLGDGLVGYALAGSTMRWSLPVGTRLLGQGTIRILAQGDSGPIHAAAAVLPSR